MVWFVEGEATDLATNKSCYVALRVMVANGVATPIEIISPDASTFQQEFPDQKKIESMVGYNKFAVSPDDVVGYWEESSTTSLNYYNSYTGGYAGTNMSAMANSFTIKNDGSYESEHKGMYGMMGSATAYDEVYKGKYTLTPWNITMTNRFKGRTDSFTCQYEAVRGGRILLLVDKVATSMDYRLVKVK